MAHYTRDIWLLRQFLGLKCYSGLILSRWKLSVLIIKNLRVWAVVISSSVFMAAGQELKLG